MYTLLFLYITFHSGNLHLFQNYYDLHIKLIFWKQKSTIGSYTSKKVILSRVSPCFFQHFDFLMKPFITHWKVCHRIPFRHYSTLFIASWRGLCVVKGVESSVCLRFVNYNIGVILSQSTGAWQVSAMRCIVNMQKSLSGHRFLSGASSMRIAFREIRLARI